MLPVLFATCAAVGALALVVIAAAAVLVAVKVRLACDRVMSSAARISGAVSAARELADRIAGRETEPGAVGQSPRWADLISGRTTPRRR